MRNTFPEQEESRVGGHGGGTNNEGGEHILGKRSLGELQVRRCVALTWLLLPGKMNRI